MKKWYIHLWESFAVWDENLVLAVESKSKENQICVGLDNSSKVLRVS